jgi:hypothetical protein
MDSFQLIVLAIATVILILILAVLGMMLSNYRNKEAYPPVANTCPDYWNVTSDGTACSIPSNNSTSLNKGSVYNSRGTIAITRANTPGYNSRENTINFTDAGWNATGKTAVCAQKDWAATNGIIWDGISNYNSC